MEGVELSDSLDFDITPNELYNIIYRRSKDYLEDLGGLEYLVSKLKTNINSGLPEHESHINYETRISVYGKNVYDLPKSDSFLKLLWKASNDTTLRILFAASIVSLVISLCIPDKLLPQEDKESTSWTEGASILATVFIVIFVTAGNEYEKDKKFRELEKVKSNFRVKVIRGDVESQINVYDVLTGDVIILDTGDQIPADGILISGCDLAVDQSSMTGENFPVEKNDEDVFLISGTRVTDGMGRMLVLATGMNSEYGKLMASMNQESEQTPLQMRLDSLAKVIGRIGIGFAIATFIALIIHWGISISGKEWQWSFLLKWVGFFIMCISIIVVSVPEGLSLAVTISLAYSMKQMIRDQILVRRLSACETMGGATTICSDKTGTLTQNRMTVVECLVNNQIYDLNSLPNFSSKEFDIIMNNICLNSKAYINLENDIIDFVGNKTECALLMFAKNFKVNYTNLRNTIKCLKQYPFSSTRKRMSIVVDLHDHYPDLYRLYCKGASEIILSRCNKVMLSDQDIDITEDGRRELSMMINDMASRGLRTLALSYRDLQNLDYSEAPEEDMILVAIFGIMDPIRPGVPDAVRRCQRAGICVRMVTGDNYVTAKKIATDCNIFTDKLILDAKTFQQMNDEDLDAVLPDLQVLARAQPLDKLRLIKSLQKLGEVVAVTGDGTNDAPALKQSNVGLSMGIMGTEVAKSASDIIIMDDNFVSIVRSILWGRNVYSNIRKFVQFQLTVNAVALMSAFIGAVTQRGLPLTSIQLLWVNLIMDTFAALALATEKPDLILLNSKPYGRYSPLISPIMWRNIIFHAIFQLSILMVLIYLGDKIFSIKPGYGSSVPTQHYTIIFNTFVWLQIFNEINARSVSSECYNVFKGFFVNILFSAILILTSIVQVIIVEFGSRFASTEGLTPNQWIACVAIGFLSIPYGFLVRLVPTPPEEYLI